MKPVLDQKVKRLLIKKDALDGNRAIDDEEVRLRRVATKSQQITKAREYYAASKLQAIVKGYLDRLLCERKRRYLRTIKLIQRIFHGKLGRMRWKREYWRAMSVVKSDTALEEIRHRSKLLREHVVAEKRPYKWCEYFDSLTESFWYYNTLTKLNTWQVPLIFQKDLICSWNGYHEYGGAPHIKPCRCVFDTVDSYRNHLRTAHTWYCVACHQCNNGLMFPICFLCGNKYSIDGIEGEKVLHDNINNVRKQLEQFLNKDIPSKDNGLYILKSRLISLAQERENAIINMKQLQYDIDYAIKNPNIKPEKIIKLKKELENINDEYLNHMLNSNNKNNRIKYNIIDKLSNNIISRQQSNTTNNNSSNNSNSSSNRGLLSKTQNIPTNTNFPNTTTSNSDNSNTTTTIIQSSSINSRVWNEKFEDLRGLEGEKERFLHPSTKGILNETDFSMFMRIHDDNFASNLALNLYNSDDSDNDDCSSVTSQQSLTTSNTIYNNTNNTNTTTTSNNQKKIKKEMKLKLPICEKYIQGKCSLTTCAFAHPGLRDSARPKTMSTRDPNTGIKTSTKFVFLCPDCTPLYNSCSKGNNCRDYHVYIRPTTADIILAMYPIMTGRKSKDFGTAKLVGNVYRGEFDGYGVMTWRNGSTYIGDWKHSKRDGWGVCRDSEGNEYIGCFKEGVRQGWGVQTNSNGDEYIGKYSRLLYNVWVVCVYIMYYICHSTCMYSRVIVYKYIL